MDVLDNCGWKNCRQLSTTLYYGIAGLCDKHSEEWFNTEEAFLGKPKLIKHFLKLCSPDVRKDYKENGSKR